MRLDEVTCLLSISRLVLAYESSYGLGSFKNMPIYDFGLGGKLRFYNIIILSYYHIIPLYDCSPYKQSSWVSFPPGGFGDPKSALCSDFLRIQAQLLVSYPPGAR